MIISELVALPAMGMFRNGLFVAYENDIQQSTQKQLMTWLTSEETLKIIGIIDEVKYKNLL